MQTESSENSQYFQGKNIGMIHLKFLNERYC